MPRTRITDEQIVDQHFLSEIELNEFFGSTVVTGTETLTEVIQSFGQYFVQSGIIVAASGVVVSTGTSTITIGGASASENFSYEIIASGITVEVPLYQQMIVHEEFEVLPEGILNLEGTLILEE